MTRLTVHDMPVPLQIDSEGVVRVGATRVTLDTVIRAYYDGCTAEEIVEQYPALSLADVHSAIAYCLTHSAEVDAYLQAREVEAESLHREVEGVCDQRGVRERLLARQAPRQGGS